MHHEDRVVKRWAHISDDEKYRYALGRSWHAEDEKYPRLAVWIGLNPSTADGTKDDPTITRLITFTRDWGLDGFVIVNLFALRSSKPSALLRAKDPVGPENDTWLLHYTLRATVAIACWGTKGGYRGRDREFLDTVLPIKHLSCLGRNSGGSPKHPLYLAAETRLQEYR